jgi:hypothetical protein
MSSLLKRLDELERRVEKLMTETAEQAAEMHRWQLLSLAIRGALRKHIYCSCMIRANTLTGINLFIWTTVLQQPQRDELNAMGIRTCMSVSIE